MGRTKASSSTNAAVAAPATAASRPTPSVPGVTSSVAGAAVRVVDGGTGGGEGHAQVPTVLGDKDFDLIRAFLRKVRSQREQQQLKLKLQQQQQQQSAMATPPAAPACAEAAIGR